MGNEILVINQIDLMFVSVPLFNEPIYATLPDRDIWGAFHSSKILRKFRYNIEWNRKFPKARFENFGQLSK